MKIESPRLLPNDPAYGVECLMVLEKPYLKAEREGRVGQLLLAVQEAGWLPETAAEAIATINSRQDIRRP